MVSSFGFDIDYNLSACITEVEAELDWRRITEYIPEWMPTEYIPECMPTVRLELSTLTSYYDLWDLWESRTLHSARQIPLALPKCHYDLWESPTLHSAGQIPPPVPMVLEPSPSFVSPSNPSTAKVCANPNPDPNSNPDPDSDPNSDPNPYPNPEPVTLTLTLTLTR